MLLDIGKEAYVIKILKKVSKNIDILSEWTGKIFIWLILILVLVDVYEVFARYILNSPHMWSMNIITWIYGSHFMLLAGYTLLHNRHVSIDIFYLRFSPKTQAILDIITYLLFFFPFLVIIIWFGSKYAAFSWKIKETTTTTQPLPVYLYKTVLPISVTLLLFQGLSEFIKKILFLIEGEVKI